MLILKAWLRIPCSQPIETHCQWAW